MSYILALTDGQTWTITKQQLEKYPALNDLISFGNYELDSANAIPITYDDPQALDLIFSSDYKTITDFPMLIRLAKAFDYVADDETLQKILRNIMKWLHQDFSDQQKEYIRQLISTIPWLITKLMALLLKIETYYFRQYYMYNTDDTSIYKIYSANLDYMSVLHSTGIDIYFKGNYTGINYFGNAYLYRLDLDIIWDGISNDGQLYRFIVEEDNLVLELHDVNKNITTRVNTQFLPGELSKPIGQPIISSSLDNYFISAYGRNDKPGVTKTVYMGRVGQSPISAQVPDTVEWENILIVSSTATTIVFNSHTAAAKYNIVSKIGRDIVINTVQFNNHIKEIHISYSGRVIAVELDDDDYLNKVIFISNEGQIISEIDVDREHFRGISDEYAMFSSGVTLNAYNIHHPKDIPMERYILYIPETDLDEEEELVDMKLLAGENNTFMIASIYDYVYLQGQILSLLLDKFRLSTHHDVENFYENVVGQSLDWSYYIHPRDIVIDDEH